MSVSHLTTLLCSYRYDPLDRLVGSIPYQQTSIQRFYCRNRLATQIQGGVQCSIFQHAEHLLAQQQYHDAKVDSHLLATDTQRSVLTSVEGEETQQFAYSPYGHRPSEHDAVSLPGFNGERLDPFTRHYHLGNGYRQFNPVLMRFNSPDSRSPFGEGGLNSYAYCEGDPRNWLDETGRGRVPNVSKPIQTMLNTSNSRRLKAPTKSPVLSETRAHAAPSYRSMTKVQRSDYHRAASKRNHERRRDLVYTIRTNEAAFRKKYPQGYGYNTSDDLTDLEAGKRAYEVAKRDYEFERYPDVNQEWRVGKADGPLDVAHFDAARSHYRNMHYNHMAGASWDAVWNIEISRAKYINKHLGINFMVRNG